MIRNVEISSILNGFIVRVGCQALAYTSIDELLLDLGSYLRNPEETEKRIIETKGINRVHTMRTEEVSNDRDVRDTAAPTASSGARAIRIADQANARSANLGGGAIGSQHFLASPGNG